MIAIVCVCVFITLVCYAGGGFFRLYISPVPENGTQGKITLPTNVASVVEARSNLPVEVVLSTIIKAEPAEGYQFSYWEKIKGDTNVMIIETNSASTILTYPGTNDVHIVAHFSKAQPLSTNTVDIGKEIKKQEIHLQGQRMEVTDKLWRLNYKIREIRDRALKQDRELKAMQETIENKQKELETRLLQKYPELQKLEDEKKQLTAQIVEIDKKLQEIRGKTDSENR
jgi:hypothetical protein